MAYTNSFHHGSECALDHNRRTEALVEREAHINKDGFHETWKDENIEDAYKRIFGAALAEYNAKQKRSDRKIKSYLQNVRQNSKLHDRYEFITQIGNETSCPDEEVCRKILKEYFEGFEKRNPNLQLIGAFYHADEVGKCPHLHCDYIPVASGKKTGLKIRNNLTEALKAQGFETRYEDDIERGINPKTNKPYQKMITAEMQFQEAERIALTEICIKHGIEIENPHRDKSEYCSSKQLREARDVRMQNDAREVKLTEREKSLSERENGLLEREKALDDKETRLNEKERNLGDRERDVAERETKFEKLEEAAQIARNEVSTYDLSPKDVEVLPPFEKHSVIATPESLGENFKHKFAEKPQDYAFRVVQHMYQWAVKKVQNFTQKYNTLQRVLFNTKYSLAKEKDTNAELKRTLEMYDYRKKTPEELEQLANKKRANQQKTQSQSIYKGFGWS